MRRTGKRWVEALIKTLWDVSWTMWDHRNGALHDSDDHAVLGNRILQDMIRREYARGQQGLPSTTRYLLAATLAEILNYGVNRKKRWLRTVQAARELGERARAYRDPTQPPLTTWFR